MDISTCDQALFFPRESEKRRTGKGKNLFVRIFILSSSTAAINSVMFLTVLEVRDVIIQPIITGLEDPFVNNDITFNQKKVQISELRVDEFVSKCISRPFFPLPPPPLPQRKRKEGLPDRKLDQTCHKPSKTCIIWSRDSYSKH